VRFELIAPQQVKHATELLESGKAVPDIAALLGVSRYTVYRSLNQAP
jgi:transcriptional antiterminator